MKIVSLYFFFIVVGLTNVCKSQVTKSNIIIYKCAIVGDTLKVVFKNEGNKKELVPVLEYRFGFDTSALYSKYYYYNDDTLVVTLNSYLDPSLYKIISSKDVFKSETKVSYVDKLLEPGKLFATQVKILSIRKYRSIVLLYNQFRWTYFFG